MYSAHLGRDLVGVDLVAEQHERVRPVVGVAAAHVVGEHAQRVDLAALGVLVLGQRVRRLGAGAHTRQEPQAIRNGAPAPSVRITLGGNGRAVLAARRGAPSSRTS